MSRTSTGPRAADLADHARHRRLVPAAVVDDSAGIVDVDALERGGEAVGVALAPHLAVGDDVDAGALHVADGEERGVVLRLLEERLRRRARSRACARAAPPSTASARSTSQSGCG